MSEKNALFCQNIFFSTITNYMSFGTRAIQICVCINSNCIQRFYYIFRKTSCYLISLKRYFCPHYFVSKKKIIPIIEDR